MNRFFLGVFLSQQTLDSGVQRAIQLALDDVPGNLVDVMYYPTTSVSQVPPHCDQFLLDSSCYGSYRSILSETSTLFLAIDNYLRSQQIVILDVSASADQITGLVSENSMTYAYFNRNLINVFFMTISLYATQNIVVFTDPDPGRYQLYQNDLVEQIQTQAEMLSFPVEVRVLGESVYPVTPPYTAIFMICETVKLETLFVTPELLSSIGPRNFIMLGDISQNLHDIFGSIPTFVGVPWPLDYTSTSQRVSIETGNGTFYEIFPTYQIVYSHATNTLNPVFFSQPFSLSVYLRLNSFVDTPPPWLYSNSFSQTLRGPLYGIFMCMLTKNTLYPDPIAKQIYHDHFLCGIPVFPDSFSVLFYAGYTPFSSTPFWFDQNAAWYIYTEKYCVLTIVRNSYDITTNLDTIIPNGNLTTNGRRGISFVYTVEEMSQKFTYLAPIIPSDTYYEINPTMSSQIIMATLYNDE